MKRRDLLKAAPALLLVSAKEPVIRYFGALPPKTKNKRITFREAFSQFNGVSEERSHLWKLYELATGKPFTPHKQGTGDCVGHGYALAADLLAAADIFMRFEPEKWKARASIESIYGGSRVQIGTSPIWEGSHGIWAARFLNEYGVLHRLQYPNHDLTGYDPDRSDLFGRKGVPEPLLTIAKEHPCATYTKITTWQQAKDALYMGQPVILCSSYAFETQRDKNGFAKQKTGYYHGFFNRRYTRPKWYHCMLLAGYERNDGLIINSWGEDWISGPKRLGQPEGSFWAKSEEIEKMLKEWEDCFAISNYKGFPEKVIDHKLY